MGAVFLLYGGRVVAMLARVRLLVVVRKGKGVKQ